MKITVFILPFCPYCTKIKEYIKDISENKLFPNIEFEYIDESLNRHLAEEYDYYYVPSLFVASKKLHEGEISKNQFINLLKELS